MRAAVGLIILSSLVPVSVAQNSTNDTNASTASTTSTTSTTSVSSTTTSITVTTVTATATTITQTSGTSTTSTTTTGFSCPFYSDVLASQSSPSICTTTTTTTSTSSVTSSTSTTSTSTVTSSTSSTTTKTTSTSSTSSSTVTTSTSSSTTKTTSTSSTTTGTVTSSTSTSTSVSTSTTSSSSVTATSATSTTSTDTTSTATTTSTTSSTVSATTVTSTTSSGTTTTSTGLDCVYCPLPPVTGCSSVTPGGTCTPTKKSTTHCVEDIAMPVLQCPAGNVLWRPPSIASSAYPKVKCQVCSVSDSADTDGRTGYYTGKLSFGANKINGVIDESQIVEYKVYFANSSGYKQGAAVGSVTTKGSHVASGCCDETSYAVTLHGVELVTNYLMVVPVDTDGYEMSVGAMGTLSDQTFGSPKPHVLLTGQTTLDTCTTTTTTSTATSSTTTATTTWWTTYTVTSTTSTSVTSSTSSTTTISTSTTTKTSSTSSTTTISTSTTTKTSSTSSSTTATTSTTTSSSMTTSSTTATTSTSSSTTKTTSTSSTSSSTVSSTTSSTSTSTLTTTTTVTAATSCTSCSWMPLTGCNSIDSGASCTPTVMASPCIVDNSASYTCPANNEQTQVAALTNYPTVQCKVCGIAGLSVDANTGSGIYTGTLQFGPNQVSNEVNETFIVEYKIYFVDTDGNKLGASLASVEAADGFAETCCQDNAYSVTLSSVTVPTNASHVMVVPVDWSYVEMPYGTVVALTDVKTSPSPSPSPSSPSPSSPSPSSPSPSSPSPSSPSPSSPSPSSPSPSSPSPSGGAATSTTTTTTTVRKHTKVRGHFRMRVANPHAFCADSHAQAAVKKAMAAICRAPHDTVQTICAPVTTRRLKNQKLRRLQDSNVNIEYIITIPQDVMETLSISTGDEIANIITSTSTDALTQVIAQKLAEEPGAATYTVAVTSVPTAEVEVITYTQTTTTKTETATRTTVLQAGVDSMAHHQAELTTAHVLAPLLILMLF